MKKLATIKQLMKLTRKQLLKKISGEFSKHLNTFSKKELAVTCYNITKSKLPRLKKGFIELDVEHYTKTGIEKWYPKSKVRKVAPINPRTYLVKSRRKTKRKTKKIVGKIYYTKNGQPYKILKSGKARFMKK